MVELINTKTGVTVCVSRETAGRLGPEFKPTQPAKRAPRRVSKQGS